MSKVLSSKVKTVKKSIRCSGYLDGPSLCGFHGAFEQDFGDPSTPEPYPIVKPAKVAGVLLPFACPHCERVFAEFADPKAKEHYHDTRRELNEDGSLKVQHNNYFCPGCQKRFRIDPEGRALSVPLPATAPVAPSVVVTPEGEEMHDPMSAAARHNRGIDVVAGLSR